MDKFKQRLLEHKNYIEQKGFDIAFYSLKGSQNYGLSTENSDVDSYFVVMPSLKDLAYGKPPISTGYKVNDSGTEEYIIVKDIRVFLKEAENYDFTALEILFSKYLTFEPRYFEAGQLLKDFDFTKNSLIALFRMRRRCEEFSKEVENLNFEFKGDRKSFVRFLTDCNFLMNLSFRIPSFLIIDEEERHNILSIKQGIYTKEKALELFPLSKIKEKVNDNHFSNLFCMTYGRSYYLKEILYNFFETKFKEI